MIISIDTETKGLNTSEKGFILGVITLENHKQETYFTRKGMWERILQLGEREQKQGKKLYVYQHGDYDANVLYDPEDEEITEICLFPLIICRKNIEFINTRQLFRDSLQGIGEMIELEKIGQDLDVERFVSKEYVKQNLLKIEEYCARDSLIVMKLMQQLKQTLKEDGIKPRAIRTMASIGLNYIMRELRKDAQPGLFWNPDITYRGFHYTNNKEHIHKAYRGAIINAFQQGTYENTWQIDYNSMYPWAISNIQIPDLRTEIHIENPLNEITESVMLNNIGVTTCLIDTRKVKTPLLQIRMKIEDGEREEYTNHGLIYGTWTNLELKRAKQIGYKILYYDKTTTYTRNINNPFKTIFEEMYGKRLENKLKKRLYKGMMNQAIGKLAQRREKMEIKWDDDWKLFDYAQEGYRVIQEKGNRYKYMKKGEIQYRSDYCPIIPTYVNALARIELHKAIDQIGIENTIYSDTDSILMKKDLRHKINIGNQIGQWKTEKENAKSHIYGRKLYSIDNNIKIKGIPKRFQTIEAWNKGKIPYERNQRKKKEKLTDNAIGIEKLELDLMKSLKNEQERQKKIKECKYIIDNHEKITEGQQQHIESFI